MPKFQCYSAVVARSSCSSVSDAFSEKSGPTPALYSQKAAPLAYSSTERGTVTKLPLTLIVLGASEPRLSVQQAPVPGKSENIDTSRFQPFCSSGSVEIVIICLAAVIVSGNIMLLNIVVETALFDKYTIRKRDDGLLVPPACHMAQIPRSYCYSHPASFAAVQMCCHSFCFIVSEVGCVMRSLFGP